MSDAVPAAPNSVPVLAGPILRRMDSRHLSLWLCTSEPLDLMLGLYRDDDGSADTPDDLIALAAHRFDVPVGERAWIVMIDVDLEAADRPPFVADQPIGYDLFYGENQRSLADDEPGLRYADERRPRFVLRPTLEHLLHGSCRRPHHPSGDGMARADRWVASRRHTPSQWPGQLLLTGDQIYADDVAGPMLRAIHVLIERLGLWPEDLTGATVDDSDALYASDKTYYLRDDLLPKEKQNTALRERFFGGTRKPVFTSACSGNHLITFAEGIAMYLLTWSDAPWRGLETTAPRLEDKALIKRYDEEQAVIDRFRSELASTRRVMANTPTAMIFDDHDVTDDWNLTADWEDSVYGHPFSRRIIGNARIAYTLCQGWGNRPDVFRARLGDVIREYAQQPTLQTHDTLIDTLLEFDQWHFMIESDPPILVLDTRMHRWRREHKPSQPSGLMNWEALTQVQIDMMGRRSAVIVSAAPIFGVKLIENIQRIFTWFGKPLMVDAENWMAHRGAATAMLQILSHRNTPQNFTVLSGDVHYSFVYDVTLRLGLTQQKIWQITSSGVKNEFPETLLVWFDRLNRWLYSPHSPLNWFTKRRRLRVAPRNPRDSATSRRLVNNAGIGYVRFNDQGQPIEILQLGANDVDTYFDQRGDRET
jgi:hypothetical protein